METKSGATGPAAASSRSTQRTKVLMGGTLFTPDGARRVRIRDVSLSGVQVSADAPIPHNCDAIFRRGPIFVAARVVRSRGRDAGLEFYRELNPTELDTVFRAVAG